jgi:lysophospholipase L1-like esterase
MIKPKYHQVLLLALLWNVSLLAQPDENNVSVVSKPEHPAEVVARAAAEIGQVTYLPPKDRWRHLPRTASLLAKPASELRVVMLGDSIINDTARSRWGDRLQIHYPNCKISVVAVVRGSTGCWWYKNSGRIRRYVLPLHPDLLIIGGISQNSDIPSIRKVIRQVRATNACDVLLMSGAFGQTDPRDDNQWSFNIPSAPDNYRAQLRSLATKLHIGFLDMSAPWGAYIRQSGKPLEWFKRDRIHANERGEQLMGSILASYLSPPLTDE